MKLDTDFNDAPTKVDIEAPAKAKHAYQWGRQVDQIVAGWDMEEFQRTLREAYVKHSEEFPDEPTVEIGRPKVSMWTKIRYALYPFIRV